MADHLSANELAGLVGCEPNQRAIMRRWLDGHRWHYETDRMGLPKVAREYYNRKMGISDGKTKAKYAETPNLKAFA